MKNVYKKIIASLNREGVNRFAESPLFIIGCERSGTTAFEKALNLHSSIKVFSPDAPLVHHFAEIAFEYSQGSKNEYYQSSTQLHVDEFRTRLARLCFESIWGNDLGFIYSPFSRAQKNSVFTAGKHLRFWSAKIFSSREQAQGLKWLYPNAKFVYIYRNGLDVVASMMKFKSFRNRRFEENCRTWVEKIFRYDYLRNFPDAAAIRFEEFVDNPEMELKKVWKLTNLAPEDQPVQLLRTTLIHPLDQGTHSANPKQILKNRAPGWHEWTDEQRKSFRQICRYAMTLAGYDMPF